MRLLTPKQTARLLHLPPTCLAGYVGGGLTPIVRNRRTYYERAEVLTLALQREKAASHAAEQ